MGQSGVTTLNVATLNGLSASAVGVQTDISGIGTNQTMGLVARYSPSEIQTVTVNGTAGTFTLTFGGQTTLPIAVNTPAGTVQADLTALSSIGANNVVVTQVGNVYTLTFQETLAGTNLAQIKATGAGGATVTTATVNDGGFNNMYIGSVTNTGTSLVFTIYSDIDNTMKALMTTTLAYTGAVPGTILRLEAIGPSLKLYLDGKIEAYAEDSHLSSGSVGMRVSAGAAVTSFEADAITLPTPPVLLPFTANFTASPPGQQLGVGWQDDVGNFNIGTGAAVGQSATNLSTVTNLSATNVTVQANISMASFTATGAFFDLVTRYNGPGNSSYYSVEVAKTATGYTASIYYFNSAGVRKTLATKTLVTFAGGHDFQIAANVLTLTVDGIPQLAVNDNSIAGPGAIGMMTSLGVAVTSFTAN